MADSLTNSPVPRAPRLLDRVRNAIRRLHYSERTEQTYIHWIKRFIYLSGTRHHYSSDGDRGLDGRMALVVADLEVLEPVVEDRWRLA